jgi:hypothetical protein
MMHVTGYVADGVIIMQATALKYDVAVNDQGRLELPVPFPAGAHVVVFVVREDGDTFTDLVTASQTSLSFWDNPFDDEDWNNV